MKNQMFTFLLALFISASTFAQLSGTKNIPGDYTNIATAIADLNTQGVGAGGVTFNVATDYTETFALATNGLITATGTASNPIVFHKSGVGANPKITAATGTSTSLDAIITIAGGDYITFDGIDLYENASNANQTTRMEFGYSLVKKNGTAPIDGCQYVTIKNCNITMETYLTATTFTTATGIYSGNHTATLLSNLELAATSDASNNCKFYSNTISNVTYGIRLQGWSGAPEPFNLWDSNNEIGVDGGNTITKFTANAINPRYHKNLKVANNIITQNYLVSASPFYGIYMQNIATNEVYNNTISIQPTGGSNTNPSLNGITLSQGYPGFTDKIYNNTVQNCTNPLATSQGFTGIASSGSTTDLYIYDNKVLNNTCPGTGSFSGIQSGSPTNLYFYNNEVSNNTKTGNGGSFTAITVNTQSTSNVYGNLVFGNKNNTSALVTQGATMYGINSSNGNPANIYNNKIYDLENVGGAVNFSMAGLYIGSGTVVNINNNYIYDLRAPIAQPNANPTINPTSNLISGIASATSPQNLNIFYNTIFLNATSTGAHFSTAAIQNGNGPKTNIRNNILVNLSTPNGSGITTALRRTSTTLDNYLNISNTNCFFVGIEDANHVTYYDGTTSYNFGAFQAFVGPVRESASFYELPPFVNFFVSPFDVHLTAGASTRCESGGISIPSITTDFDGDLRGPAPDVGADEFNGVAIGVINPGSVAATAISSHQINVSYLTNPSDNNVLILWNNTGAFTTPTGAPPAVGEAFAGGTVLAYGKSTPVAHSNLPGVTSFYYKAFSYDGTDYSVGIIAGATTNIAPPSNFVATTASATEINLSWTKNAFNNDVIVAYNNWDAFGQPVNGVVYTPGSVLNGDGGTVIYVGPLNGFLHSGLTPNLVQYYYKIWSYDPTNMNIYSLTGNTATASTFCSTATIPYDDSFEWGGTLGCGDFKDVQNNSDTWYANFGFARTGVYSLRINGGASSPAKDDWYFTNGLELSNGNAYLVKFWYRTQNLNGNRHQIEIKWGNEKTVAGMANGPVYYNNSLVPGTIYTQVTCQVFVPATTGVYWVGLHNFTPYAPGHALFIDNITIEAIPLPQPPSSFSATLNGVDIDLAWNKNAANDDVIIATNTTGTFDNPVLGTNYQVGNTIGTNGTVIYRGPLSAYKHTNIDPVTTYYYKAWSVTAQNYYSSEGATANATTEMFQPICIPTGWSAISSFMIPESANVENVLADIANNMQIILSKSGFYWPSQNINTFGDWSAYKGYKIKMNTQACINMTGNEVENRTINVLAGVSYIPVLCDQAVQAATIFSQLGSGFVYAFDIHAGLVYWPAGQIYTLNYLEPGKGYLVNMSQAGQATYVCGVTDLSGFESAEPIQYQNAPWVFSPSGEQHLISISQSALAGLEKGDYIGVFNASGVCSGIAQYNGSHENLLIIANSDDFTTSSNDGLTPEEAMSFRIYKSGKGLEIPVEVEFSSDMPNSGIFTDMGQSMIVKMTESATSIDETKLNDFQIYPNPGHGLFTIVMPFVNQTVSVVVKNSTGQQVYSQKIDNKTNRDLKIDLSHINAGVYFVTISCNNEILVKKLIVR